MPAPIITSLTNAPWNITVPVVLRLPWAQKEQYIAAIRAKAIRPPGGFKVGYVPLDQDVFNALANDLPALFSPLFDGVELLMGDLLVAPALPGANLLTKRFDSIAQNYIDAGRDGQLPVSWFTGDFDGDGEIAQADQDVFDAALLASQ